MSDFTISLPQLEVLKAQKWADNVVREKKDEIRALMVKCMRSIERRAKSFAPVDKGFLRGSISAQSSSDRMSFEVSAGEKISRGVKVKYAPFVEFGTGTKVSVPADVAKYALQFKGKGIRKVNQRAQPYFFPAVRVSINELMVNLKNIGIE